MFTRGATWLALALGAALLAVLPSTSADAAPADCSSTALNVYRWVGQGATADWGDPNNWRHGPADSVPPRAPNDDLNNDANPDTNNTVACIGAEFGAPLPPGGFDHVFVDDVSYSGGVWVQELYASGSFTITVTPQTGLFVNGAGVLGPQTALVVNSATFGGLGDTVAHGSVVLSSVTGPATLSTDWITASSNGTYANEEGLLVLGDTGVLQVPGAGAAMRLGYDVDVTGHAIVAGAGYLAIDAGTRLRLLPGAGRAGTLELRNNGGVYQGFLDADLAGGTQPKAALVNQGLLTKTGGGGVSVVDVDYSAAGGDVAVLSGTIALPDNGPGSAQVAPARSLSTGRCTSANSSNGCALATTPAVDPQSVTLTVPASDASGARIQVREEGPATALVGPRGLQNVVHAHADGLSAPSTDPAVITLRFDAAQAGSSNIDTLSVARQPEGGGAVTYLPSCEGTGAHPPGSTSCVDRRGLPGSSRFEGPNVYVVVRTTTTSRWAIRKELVDLIAPTTLAAPQVLGRPKLGRKLTVTAAYGESCVASAKGRVKAKANGRPVKGLKLKPISVSAPAAAPVRLVVKLTKASQRKLRASGARSGTAILSVSCADRAGNVTGPTTLRVKLR